MLQQLTRWQTQACTFLTMGTRSCSRLEELEPMFQRRVRLRAHHCSATQAMCKTSWEIYSLWALDPSGGSAPPAALRTSPPLIDLPEKFEQQVREGVPKGLNNRSRTTSSGS